MGPRAPELRLTGVGRRYGPLGPWVLRQVDLALPAGKLVRVRGANGTGKSTLLRLLAGLDAPTEGRITGRPRTAYVPERFPPRLPFTAVGYLTHLGRVHGLSRPAAVREARHWLERLGAADHAATPLSALSKGTSQKVAVAQALLAAPGLIVLDEAWSGLDPDAHAALDAAVTERVAEGAVVVFVDHRPADLADRVDLLLTVTKGRVQSSAPNPPAVARSGEPAAPPGTEAPSWTSRTTSWTEIEAVGPDGSGPPPPPGGFPPVRTSRGTHLLTVPGDSSDEVLRALLTAGPPWHIVSVRGVPRPTPPRAPAPQGSPDVLPDPPPDRADGVPDHPHGLPEEHR
ncbi:ATP-binding cassette domain-containing protein [Streptomyces sp. JNUCC 64]